MKAIIHGHFYQPPREDPITHLIPNERGAAPFQNWNERINAECYYPNARLGNFGKISFNIGPTLFQWMEENAPETARMIVEQERANFLAEGVGNGMAQAFHHCILPLQSRRDKVTQIRWGLEDFKFRFGHTPDGMWLPETAVDMETLCVLSDEGLRFTILVPWQINPIEGSDVSEPFFIELPDGRKPFVVFPYDREESTKISFLPKVTENGDAFLLDLLSKQNEKPGLRLIASDGELYGHHQPFRDLFLSYILGAGGESKNICWTYPALYLKQYGVKRYAMLVESSSWSCLHGVKRWACECGCTPGAFWKAPMRNALDAIGNWVDARYIQAFGNLPMASDEKDERLWELRHRYIDVMLGRKTIAEVGKEVFGAEWNGLDLNQIQVLLEAQLERQKMFNSCGWFFDDFNRIEPANNIAHAAKAVWLCQQVDETPMDQHLYALLRKTFSPVTGLNAEMIFNQTLARANQELRSRSL